MKFVQGEKYLGLDFPYLRASNGLLSKTDKSVTFTTNPLYPNVSAVVPLNLIQSGSGTPSVDNVRPISGWDKIVVTCNGTSQTFNFPETVVGGSLNVGTGVLTITHKLFRKNVDELAGSEDYPRWIDASIRECVVDGHNDGIPGATSSISPGRTDRFNFIGANTTSTSKLIMLRMGLIGMTMSELKTKLVGKTIEIVLPLLTPKKIQLQPFPLVANANGETTISTDADSITVAYSVNT